MVNVSAVISYYYHSFKYLVLKNGYTPCLNALMLTRRMKTCNFSTKMLKIFTPAVYYLTITSHVWILGMLLSKCLDRSCGWLQRCLYCVMVGVMT